MLFHVEAAANPKIEGPVTPLGDPLTAGDEPLYRLEQAELAVFEETVWELVLDLEVLGELMLELRSRTRVAGRSPGPSAGRYRRPLLIAFLLTVFFVAAEFVTGILAGSLALSSDAGHMLSDAAGLGMSLAAIALAMAGSKAVHRTHGWYRLEILAALANTSLLFGVAGYVAYEAINRIGTTRDVHSTR